MRLQENIGTVTIEVAYHLKVYAGDATAPGIGANERTTMLAGHIGIAAGTKRWVPEIPLWVLLLASFSLDILMVILWGFGIERLSLPNDGHGGYGKLVYEIDWSHSFTGTLALCFIVLIMASRWWGARGGFALAVVIFLHWFLDLLVHKGSLPMTPGNIGGLPRVGLGLWDAPIVVIVLEFALILGGSWLWYSSPVATKRGKRTSAITAVVGTIILLIDSLG